MAKIRDQLRIKPTRGIDHRSPIEDQVQEVYHAARKLAEAKGFKPYTHDGPHGSVRGRSGPMVLKLLVKQLFPGYKDDEFSVAYSIINQALRRTDGAVCIKQPRNAGFNAGGQPVNPNDMPLWFIADKLPKNLVIVTTGIAKKSADQNRDASFSEDRFLTKREKRLHDEEINRPAGPVSVSFQTAGEDTAEPDAFADARERKAREHAEFVKRVHEEIQTQPQPVTALDLVTIINHDDGTAWHASTIRNALEKLEREHKIVSRKETADEALIRGGGHMPKATRPLLWAAAPGPVPTRTALPDGIQPVRSAYDLAQETSQRQLVIEQECIRVMSIRGSRGNLPPRNIKQIHENQTLGLTKDEIRAGLERLVHKGTLYKKDKGGYYFAERVKGEYRKPVEIAAPVEQPLPTPDPEVTVQTAPSVKPPADTNLEIVLDLARRLGVELPKVDDGRVAQLEQDNEALAAENATLQNQVKALKAAIAALT